MSTDHTHGTGVHLEEAAQATLQRGLSELLHMSEGYRFHPLVSDRYPLPLALAVYGETPEPEAVRERVSSRMGPDPVDALEAALVLLELYECNQPEAAAAIPDDGVFLGQVFGSKRLNGWMATMGDGDPAQIEEAVKARWQFRFVSSKESQTGIYPLLNLLVRYGFVYGRIPFGDSHELSHFIEDYTPGLLLCHGEMSDLELTLSLAAMKLGVPAIVPGDYPFPLGRHIKATSLDDAVEAVPLFPNVRRLLDFPDVPGLPDYLVPDSRPEEFEAAATWGDTADSFYILRKGAVEQTGVEVIGEPSGPMGIVLTLEAEPMDAYDRGYIESRAAQALSMIPGVGARAKSGRLILGLAQGTELDPTWIGETLIAAVRHEFPKIQRLRAEVIFDRKELIDMAGAVEAEMADRAREIEATTEDSVSDLIACVGCSPFAPDHVCVLTPDRPPQCGRPYEMIKTGAHYGLDDMSNIHHRALHSNMNSFNACPKREAIDPIAGEYAGLNETMWRLTGGRVKRVQLHALGDAPHTGCGCFKLIMFRTELPRAGVAIMGRGFKGKAPDGRTWEDLHYALGGKQAPGIAGASQGYLTSRKFLAAEGGWESVVWVTPDIAKTVGADLPSGIEVGDDAE